MRTAWVLIGLLALFGCDDDGGSSTPNDGGSAAGNDAGGGGGGGAGGGGGSGGFCVRPPSAAQSSTVTVSAAGTQYDQLDGWVFTSSGQTDLGIAMGISAADDRCNVLYVLELYIPAAAVGEHAVGVPDDPATSLVITGSGDVALARVVHLAEPDQLYAGGGTAALASASGTITLSRLDLSPDDDGFVQFDYAGEYQIVFTDLAGGDDVTLSGTFTETPDE
ncbi:MAG TPA: hypothetical protein QGF58_15295 [Myxococcota bacterium]|nr:hypothetical protein [Myxococcota bacterium]